MSPDGHPDLPPDAGTSALPGLWARFRWPLSVWLLNRLFLFAAVWAIVSFLPLREAPDLWNAFPGNHILNGWCRWDAGWYRGIAADGYIPPEAVVSGRQRNTAFFPVYPLTTRVAAFFTRNPFVAGVLVSNAAFLLALLLLHDFVRDRHGEAVARRTTVLLLFHPGSFFFSAMYTESLFLLWAVLAFYCLRHGAWAAAGVTAALCGATRTVGLWIVPGLGLAYLESIGYALRRVRARALWLLLGGLGPLAYMAFLAGRYGNPFEFAAAQQSPGWMSGMTLIPQGPIDALNMGVFVAAVILTFQVWRREAPSLAVWSTLMVATSFSRWPSMVRLSLVIFPLYIAAALWIQDRRIFRALVLAGAALLLFLAGRFALWYWVA